MTSPAKPQLVSSTQEVMAPEQLGWSERQLRDHVRQSKPGNPHLQAAMDLLPP